MNLSPELKTQEFSKRNSVNNTTSKTYGFYTELGYLIFFTFCFECTDLKIGFVKISEILLLLVAPLVFTKKINVVIFTFFLFFLLLFAKTIIFNPTHDFDINSDLPILKQPYFVSIGRFLELFCCIVFSQLTYTFFKNISWDESLRFLRRLIEVQIFYFAAPFLMIFLLPLLNIIPFESVFPIVYNTEAGYGFLLRIAGFYVEGGPLGLYFAFIYILFDTFYKEAGFKKYLGRGLLIIIIVLGAQSKAGVTLLSIWFLSKFAIYIVSSKKNRKLAFFILPVLLVIFVLVFFKVSEMYRKSYSAISSPQAIYYLRNALDQNTMMGRVAGVVIVPHMVQEHPILGIGMGNYPLLRNSPTYRGYLPSIPVDLWDAHGLGGLVDILVDGGLLFLIGFICILTYIVRQVKKRSLAFVPLFISFIGPFICGVQIHFLYPWFALGCLTSFMSKYDEGIYESCKFNGSDINKMNETYN